MLFQYSAGAFIYKKSNGKVLFLVLQKIRRGTEHNEKRLEYDLPKGHIEKGESAEQAAIREIKEEAGLSVSLVPYFHEATKYFFYENRQKIFKQVKFFIAKAGNDKVRISDEHTGYEWQEYGPAAQKLKHKDLVKLLGKVYDYIKRTEAMEELNRRYAELPHGAKGWQLSKNLVPGEGRLDSQLMVIGQAPGKNEDIKQRPFVGRSGMLLDKLLKKGGFNRSKVYIMNVVQFFPPENRMPTDAEVELCRPFLEEQISLIKPRYMILLGNLASMTVAGIGEVQSNHGKIIEKSGIKCLITFHPAAALRFRGNEELMISDFRKLKQDIAK
ncbi:MAG: NUDIX domain-containing protein [Candidatus Micrarchaeota archaeon]|nr:NUDIX domain-containing protein [Candidatus Micrarchaeota archaeon]MDE1824146.1 NUDIX domain-containing protein [Candidatus Micrarchaeota archaeon]MDE1849919.1 NUDIX domain-containing protein [Candidatus Micrarchaeota archaeon]